MPAQETLKTDRATEQLPTSGCGGWANRARGWPGLAIAVPDHTIERRVSASW